MQTKNRQQRRKRADIGMKVCCVTKKTAQREEMLRFVISPDETVVFDVNEKLPGAGIWITADKSVVQKAIDKKLFHKVVGKTVAVPLNLVENVADLIKQRCLLLLGLARKAGYLVFGFEGVKKALGTGQTVIAFAAEDAAENGKNKLYHSDDKIHFFEFLTREELGQITGQDSQVHVAVLRSSVADEILRSATKLDLYLNKRKD